MDLMVPISEARTKLSELVRDAEDRDVILGRHGLAAAVLISAERYEALIEQLEDAYDRLSVYESMEGHADLRIPWEKAKIELGLDD